MLFKLFCTICFIGFINAAKQITVFQNNEVLSKIECLETDFSISNFDTLHNQTIVHVTVEEACNHKLSVQKLDNVTNFIALVHMGHCSHMSKTYELQKRGARAVMLISTEDSTGMLLGLLSDYSSHIPDIPSVSITRKDGKRLIDLASQNITIQLTSNSDRSVQTGWRVYTAVFASLFMLEGLGWALCLWHLHTKPNTAASKIVCSIGLFQGIWYPFDLLFDHWNLRGFISMPFEQVIYGLGICALYVNVYLFCWLWYSIIDEKRNIKKGAIDPQYRLLPFVVLPQVSMEIMRYGLLAAGQNATEVWQVYNIVATFMLAICVGIFTFVGYRLRNVIKSILTDKENNQHKYIGWVTYVSVFNVIAGAASIYLWVFKPDFVGFPSFLIMNTLWRSFTVAENAIQMILFLPKSWKSIKELLEKSGISVERNSLTLPTISKSNYSDSVTISRQYSV